jgi:alkylation response protein AidB-like acyl-CoA dehydrogenase
VTGTEGGAVGWLEPLLPGIPGWTASGTRQVTRFQNALRDLLADYPIGNNAGPQLRSQHLARIRSGLATSNQLALAIPACDGGFGGPAVLQALMQFVCGYHDADLRDSTGLGHGRFIARHGSPRARYLWLSRLLSGELAGIAVTESHGGTQVHATTTTSTEQHDGSWTVTGTKTWISRLSEAAAFIVVFKDPDMRLTAAVVDAAAPGLDRNVIRPGGLAGWTWGELQLEDVHIQPSDILGGPGQGMLLLREHFAHYRPLVAATALGVAASVHDLVVSQLTARKAAGLITQPRDNALITLGRSYAQISAGMLAALTAQRLSEGGGGRAEVWGCAVKAFSVDTASAVVSDLALLNGAAGWVAGSPLEKAIRDLRALQYADGIHDSLYRSAGRALISLPPN